MWEPWCSSRLPDGDGKGERRTIMGAARRSKRRRRLKGWLWLGVCVGLLAVLLPRWMGSLVRGWFVPTVAARSGPLEEVVMREGLPLWRETLVESPASGNLRILVVPGQRVQKGQAVAVLETARPGDWRGAALRSETEETSVPGVGGGHTVYAPAAGLIRFDWMTPPRPDPAEALRWRDDVLREVGTVRVERAEGETIRTGDSLFRLVANHQAYMLVPWEGGPVVEEGRRLWIREVHPSWTTSSRRGEGRRDVDGEGASPGEAGSRREAWEPREWAATVVATRPVASGAAGDALLLALDVWPPGWETRTWMPVEIVVQRFEGAVVPEELLVERGGRWGVMVKGRGGPVFHPVTVRGRVDGKVAVDGLAPGLALVAGSY